ncbi:hypothetical protein JX266_003405 [Neoarthrinium moseri]|nr:hypothetical protein JX266_003405 [Neoarthrinium moseri]
MPDRHSSSPAAAPTNPRPPADSSPTNPISYLDPARQPAMSDSSSPKATPKRKRDDLALEQKLSTSPAPKAFAHPVFSFQPHSSSSSDSAEDGNSSPRTKVANKFRHLSLESGGGVTPKTLPDGSASRTGVREEHARPRHSPEALTFDFNGAAEDDDKMDDMQWDEAEESAMRKRHKLLQFDAAQSSPGPRGESSADAAGPVQVQVGEDGRLKLETAVDPAMVRVAKAGNAGDFKKAYPSINRLSDSKSRSRRRPTTPPLGPSRRKPTEGLPQEPTIVDPVRAALTWHEDEITVYDPEDKNDDGTGLNGIGFRPTPAVAYQRAQKRKKQLSEYKKREESEARAIRNQKRREQLGGGTEMKRTHSMVRVRFSDVEPETLVTT